MKILRSHFCQLTQYINLNKNSISTKKSEHTQTEYYSRITQTLTLKRNVMKVYMMCLGQIIALL